MCERPVGSLEEYKAHLAEHATCGIDGYVNVNANVCLTRGIDWYESYYTAMLLVPLLSTFYSARCQFTAHQDILEKHILAQHVTGLYNRSAIFVTHSFNQSNQDSAWK